jgi:hypothetical protein
LDAEETLLTIDGREVPAWRYLCWLAYTCDQIADGYTEAGTELDWETAVPGGTLADYAKDQALADTALYAAVETLAEQYGCTVDSEETSGAVSSPFSKNYGLDQDQLRELASVGQMYASLYQLYQDGATDLTPDDAALTAFGESLGAVTLDRILIPAGEDPEAAQQQAAETFSQLNSAADQAAAFSQLAAAGADTAGSRTVLPDDDVLDEALLSAAQELQEGQISGILESDEGFSILRRLPLDATALTEAYFDDFLQTTAETAAVTLTAEYTALDVAEFYASLQE